MVVHKELLSSCKGIESSGVDLPGLDGGHQNPPSARSSWASASTKKWKNWDIIQIVQVVHPLCVLVILTQ